MATTLYFVQSDTLPQIKLTLTDEQTNQPRDLTDKIVSIHVRPTNIGGVSFSREAIFPAGNADRIAGICYIQWLDGDLNRAPGNYTAEIEIYDSVSGGRETIYDMITIVIREDIADIAPIPLSASTSPSPGAPNPGY